MDEQSSFIDQAFEKCQSYPTWDSISTFCLGIHVELCNKEREGLIEDLLTKTIIM